MSTQLSDEKDERMHRASILVFYRQGVTFIFGLLWQDVQSESFKSDLKIPVFPLTLSCRPYHLYSFEKKKKKRLGHLPTLTSRKILELI